MPLNIAIIAEGPTDAAVIENIIYGITVDNDVQVIPLMPPSYFGNFASVDISNWSRVLTYCSSEKFRQAFTFNTFDFVIIQIDTDQRDPVNFNIPAQEDGTDTTPVRKYEFAKAILVSRIGEAFYESVRERIVFAICVESVECWLLPLFFPSARAKRSKTKNCFDTLVSHEEQDRAEVLCLASKDLQSNDKEKRTRQERPAPNEPRKVRRRHGRASAATAASVTDRECAWSVA